MSKSQAVDLFNTPTNTLGPMKRPANNSIKEVEPMKLEDTFQLKKFKRVHNQIEKISKRENKKKVISNLIYLFKK